MTKKVLNEVQFRGLVRKMVREYVANDDQNPHKKTHADPSGRNWDVGLDEMDSSDLTQAGPSEDDGYEHREQDEEHAREMQFLRRVADKGTFTDEVFPGGQSWKTIQRLLKAGDIITAGGGYDITDSGLERVAKDPGEVDEGDDDHSEVHGGKRVRDPRWTDHADPTASTWDQGLD